MADGGLDIQRVVEEVLRELRRQGVSPAPAPASPPQPPPVADGRLVLSARLVTLDMLDGRLQNIRKLVVAPQAVVTPAVRDELHRRNVELLVGAVDQSAPAEKAQLRLVLVTHGKRFDPTALLAALRAGPTTVEHHAKDCIMASSELLAAEVAKPATLGALLTRHTAAGLCLANRLAGVRAVLGLDAARCSAAAAAVGANVLVADPAGGSLFWLKRMLDAFCAGGVRECPEVFRKQLA